MGVLLLWFFFLGGGWGLEFFINFFLNCYYLNYKQICFNVQYLSKNLLSPKALKQGNHKYLAINQSNLNAKSTFSLFCKFFLSWTLSCNWNHKQICFSCPLLNQKAVIVYCTDKFSKLSNNDNITSILNVVNILWLIISVF